MLVKNISGKDKKKLTFLGLAGIVFLGFLVYSNVLYAPFFFDDYGIIVDNETIKNLKASFADLSNNRYLTLITFAINYAFAGLKPFSYHITNSLIHIINAVLVYYLVALTCKTPHLSNSKLSPQFIAFSLAFIFVSHPIQTQAVTYIVQRATSMATMFYLLSLVSYIKWRLMTVQDSMAEEQKARSGYSKIMIYSISFFSAVCAMKTKEIAFTLPVIMAIYEVFFFDNRSASRSSLPGIFKKPNLRRLIYLFPIFLTILIIPLTMMNSAAPAGTIFQDVDNLTRNAPNISRIDYFFTQSRVMMTYLRLLIFPISQNFDYRYPIYHSFFDLPVLISFLAILSMVGMSIYLFYLSRTGKNKLPSDPFAMKLSGLRFMSFGILWFFITLLVESSIIPIKDIIVEHRIYLPSFGFFIVFVAFTDYMIKNSALKKILIVSIVVLLSISAYSRNSLWKDPLKMWEDVVSKAPSNVRAYTEIGAIFRDEGRYAEANEQFEKALKINRNYALTYYNLGFVQYKLGNHENALKYFNKTLSFTLPALLHMDTLNSMGMTYSEMGDNNNAVNAFKEAIRVLPTSIYPYNNLGRQYIKTEEFELAVEILEKGIKIRDEPHLRQNLSLAYEGRSKAGNSIRRR